MKIKWLGHSAFLITTESGVKVITDPYKSGSYGGAVGYATIKDAADVVLVSHDHDDHSCVESVCGDPIVLRDAGEHESKGLKFRGIETYHDCSKGRERGRNTVFVFEADGVTVCHLGDLGHTLSADTASEIGKVDIVLVPVGGFYTIDADEATTVVDVLNPGIVIPMHYKTKKLGFQIDGVEKFLKGKEGVVRQGSSEIQITKVDFPRRFIVLDHAL
jgi:L-ascorbate metabolism protein UlaG (beta-lactamase superfamily)